VPGVTSWIKEPDSRPQPAVTPSPGARRLFLFGCVELGWRVVYFVLLRAVLWNGSGGFHAFHVTANLIWLALSVVEVALIAGFRREVGAHPAAGLLGTALALAGVNLVLMATRTLAVVGGLDLLYFPGDLGHILVTGFYVAVVLAFDIVLWRALESLLEDDVEPALRAGFFVLRLSDAAIGALTMLPFETYRSLVLQGDFGPILPWLQLLLRIGWQGLMLVALHRLSKKTILGSGTVTGVETASDVQRDYLVGGLWLGGGLLVTMISLGAATSGGGSGRYVITFGPILYGLARLLRGMSRRGRG
jgi:hypothetical protein